MPYATGYCHTGKPCVQVSGWGCGKSNALSKGLCYHPNLGLAYPGRQLLSFQPPELHELSPYRLRQRTRWPVDERRTKHATHRVQDDPVRQIKATQS